MWAVIIIIGVIQVGVIIFLYDISKKLKGLSSPDIISAREKRMESELAATQLEKKQLDAEVQQLLDVKKSILAWKDEIKEKLMEETQRDLERLAHSPVELARKLDTVLGTASSPSPTNLPKSEGDKR